MGPVYEQRTALLKDRVSNNAVFFAAADKLPDVLFNAKQNSAWQEAYGTASDFWDWLDDEIPGPDGTLVPRPERVVYVTGMWDYGLEKIKAAAVPYGKCHHSSGRYAQLTIIPRDYPWASLGSSTIVDVGAGTRQ